MKVKFTRNYQVSGGGEFYEEGKVYDLSDDSANHFFNRNAAVPYVAKKKTSKKRASK